MNYIKLPLEEICKIYKNGCSSSDIAKRYGVSPILIQRRLKKAGVLRAPGWGSKKYSVDENYFDEIDTENKAYWLGIFLTDGSTSGGVRLNLQTGDKVHIEKFQKDIGSNHPIYYVDEGTIGTSCLHIGNKHMVAMLRNKGIVPNQKRVFAVASHLQRHYWRGAIDGDGCMYKKWPPSLGLFGTEETCNEFRLFCLKFVSTDAEVKTIKENKLYSFNLHGMIALTICDVLYKDANIYLDRKYKTYLGLCEQNPIVIVGGKQVLTCEVCKQTKVLNEQNWYLNRNGNVLFGRCRKCHQELMSRRPNPFRENTKFRAEHPCPNCWKPLKNVNQTKELVYVGCRKCGFRAGSHIRIT